MDDLKAVVNEGSDASQSRPVFIDTSIVLTSCSRIGQAFAPAILEMAARGSIQAVSDSLVIQEVAEWHSVPLWDLFRTITTTVFDVTSADHRAARKLAARYPGRSPRVYLHVAVMQRCGVEQIYALADAGYHDLPGIQSLPLVTIV